MTKVLRYLKPHILSLVFAVALICCTVICDLSLPTLMSNIVSTGIQQGGVEDAAPAAISQNGYKLMTTFMTEDEKELTEAIAESLFFQEEALQKDVVTLLAKADLRLASEVEKRLL